MAGDQNSLALDLSDRSRFAPAAWPRWYVVGPLALYAATVAFAVHFHEPWADEAQAWLIARDASLTEIWTRLVRLEGSPGLWHSLLHLLIKAGLPYAGLNLVSGFLGCAAAFVVIRFAPFPAPIRVLLPFTYFLCFQYSVIARNYSLVPLLLFSAAAAHRARRFGALAALLVLMAAASSQAFLLSCSFALVVACEHAVAWPGISPASRKTFGTYASFYVVGLALIALAVWPNGKTVFFVSPNWSLQNFIGISRYAFHQAFGEGYWPILILGLSLPLLSRGYGLTFFLLSSFALCLLGSVVYSNVWHHGFLVLSWLAALWISYRPGKATRPAVAAILLLIASQCLWTWKAVRYEWRNAYSGSRAMAKRLISEHAKGSKVFAAGFPTVSLQPYFESNLFENYDGLRAGRQSFWMWSRANTTNDAMERLGSEHPDWVVLGYAGESDRKLWSHLITRSGYREIAHSEGNLFWRDQTFQPENFELYVPGSQIVDSSLLGNIDLRGTSGEEQLLWGFSEPPSDRGRNVSANAGLVIQRPTAVRDQKGACFQMTFDVSSEQFQKAGSMVLSVYVSGRRMQRMAIAHPGAFHYVANVAANDLFWAVIPVAMQFEKADLFSPALTRDSIAVVSQVGLTAQ